MMVPGSPQVKYEHSVDKARTRTTRDHADSRFHGCGSPKQALWNGLSKSSTIGMKPREQQKLWHQQRI